jgi:signal transduction histidine kinase
MALDVPFIIVSGTIGEEAAVELMRAGAHDFVLKDKLARLVPAVEREIVEARNRVEQARMREQLRKSEETLARSERLRAIGQMASGISHDIKNLFHPLLLHAQLLEMALASGNVDEAREAVTEIKQVVRIGLERLERLRVFSRRPTESKAESLDLNRIAREATELAKPRLSTVAPGRVISIERELGNPLPFRGYASDILSAVLNIIVNAIDAMKDGGTITVRTGEAEGCAWIRIEDDGPGMSEEVQQRAFEPFFSTKGDEGTGLGLAMVQSCVRQHGGKVTLETAPGQGAKFTLWFPETRGRFDRVRAE